MNPGHELVGRDDQRSTIGVEVGAVIARADEDPILGGWQLRSNAPKELELSHRRSFSICAARLSDWVCETQRDR